ncbi:MAG: peptidase S41 [Flavobacteriaceae bacterium]
MIKDLIDMKYTFLKRILQILLISITIVSCQKSDDAAPVEIEVQDFVWKGMNAYYLWQDQISDLADTRFSSQRQLNAYLQGFPDPRDLFQNLLFQPGVGDRFSWIVDDYVALENSFQGINESNGMEIGLVRFVDTPTDVFAYVRYVVPGSDAETQGVMRGMLITEIDGTQLTDTNFNTLLVPTSYTIGLADYNSGNPTTNGTTILLTKAQLQENPVAIVKTITDGSNKIGYLFYNQFSSSFDGELNAAFAQLQSENITDLIIDLRYNGGGSVRTATYMGGMVTGQFDGQLFSKQVWNTKVQANVNPSNFENNFTNQLNNGVLNEMINNLNLTRVYFITTGSTASASELVMNSLDSYIDVFSVGTTTIGKVHGSVTIYDSDNYLKNGPNFNQNHFWAMQPLVLEIQNSDSRNQPQGIPPSINLPEDYENLGVLGERSDPLLDRTIVFIVTGNRTSISSSNNSIHMEEIGSSKTNKPALNSMYVDLKE